MDVGKATRVALGRANKRTPWLAKELGHSYEWTRRLTQRRSVQTATVEKLAKVFGMPPLEFLKLGEE